MITLHHTSEDVCPLCQEKLKQAHPYLATWFNTKVKPFHPQSHVAIAFRGKEDQERAVAEKKSRLSFPKSAHNHMTGDQPESRALDLFEISEDGVALFRKEFYVALNDQNEKTGEPLFWGGRWKELGDFDHFQLELKAPTSTS